MLGPEALSGWLLALATMTMTTTTTRDRTKSWLVVYPLREVRIQMGPQMVASCLCCWRSSQYSSKTPSRVARTVNRGHHTTSFSLIAVRILLVSGLFCGTTKYSYSLDKGGFRPTWLITLITLRRRRGIRALMECYSRTETVLLLFGKVHSP